jgi:hypothetical protein
VSIESDMHLTDQIVNIWHHKKKEVETIWEIFKGRGNKSNAKYFLCLSQINDVYKKTTWKKTHISFISIKRDTSSSFIIIFST